jgi:UDP-3-O-[3-hydroxymyristoyl] glucosamine N-acyltransferase
MRISEIAAHLGARLLGEDGEVSSCAPIFKAGPRDLSLLAWPKDIRLAKRTRIGALLISTDWAADYADEIPSSLLVIDNLTEAFKRLFILLKQGLNQQSLVTQASIHASARVSPQAYVGLAHVGAQSIISPGAIISDDVVIGSNCHISSGVFIASGTRLGDNNFVGANSVIGSEAFAPFEDQVLCSLGNVVIKNNIRIGALCTIDRALLGSTLINNNCLLDNHVHVGHDAELGEKVVIAAQTGLAGFVQIGEGATLGGQVGVAPHVMIGAHARVSAKTFVHKALGSYEICSGNPGLAHEQYLSVYKKNTKTKSRKLSYE